MQTGTKISAAVHLGLIAAALLAGRFAPAPLPFEVREVTVISSEDFAVLSARKAAPLVSDTTSVLPEPDSVAPDPDIAPATDAQPEQAPPDPAPAPSTDPVPEPVRDETPPEADVSDSPPVLAPPVQESADTAPAIRPQPRQSDRVAPLPVAPPPPDVATGEETLPEVADQGEAETPRDQQEASVPEEATDRIVTEADQTQSAAPSRSPRPAARPRTPPAAEATAEPESTRQAIADALAEAQAAPAQTAPSQAETPSGPPLSAGEKDALRVAVQQCWNVGSLSSEAIATTVVVGVSLDQTGKPVPNSIQLLSSEGGTDGSARQAFEAARRAILRCGATGYDLPADKYEQWRDIEMTFNPERMRIK